MDAASQIQNAYQTYLGRAASQDEVNWRIGQLGVRSLTSQLADISSSPEAASHRTNSVNSAQQAVIDAANKQSADMQALIDRQNAEQQGLFNQYTDKINSQEKLPDLYTRLSNELGIPGLSSQVQGYKNDIYRVQGLLDHLDEDVTARTMGTLTSEGARNRIIASEATPLNTQIARLGTGMQPLADLLTGAQNQLSTMVPLYIQQQEKDLQPLEMQINSLSDKFSREITGFTTSKQNELNVLMDKLQRERQLSDQEWQAAQDLAKDARAFEQQKALASSYLSNNTSSNTASNTNTVRALPNVSSPSIQSVGVLQNPGTISSVGVANPGKITSVGVAQNVGTLGAGW